uniref:TSA: Wollemia nobilis Ref_Wollemi_Transcript_13942_3262 transcribed RNA sequence n=1 Tax=Wollemia nobilis TaxID=56998 RepID=A0A0C9S4G3_9CONI
MSVVGFDVGNESCIVAVARQRGIDVVLNEESKRETPALVSFGEKQRFIGTAGAASSTMNPKNAVSQIKRLIGKQFSDPELQRDLHSLPFTVTEGPDGMPLIHAQYLGESKAFTPTQILAMVLSNLKQIAKENLKNEIVDCCIGIPVYFTDLQRRAYLDAAAIVGLNPLCLLHETTATALAYGIYKTDLPETDPLNVVFVDVGHASMQVCVAAFKKGELKVLAHTWDRSLGGRDFDEVLFRHFSELFKQQYHIDVPSNARASQRLRTACEKLKKVLSANAVAPLNIECLMDEKDVRGIMKRDEFEQLAVPILQRVKGPCERALSEAGLTPDKVFAVEVVGSGSRVPSVLKILTEFFGKEPRRTMNASECVARGCALQCAILSPTFKVRDFKVQECFPFSISLSWKGATPEMEEGAPEQIVFPKGNQVSSVKAVTVYRSGTFTLDILYAEPSQVQAPQRISSYTIGPFQTANGERAKIKVKVQLNKHGVVSVMSATMIEEEEVEVPVTTVKDTPKEDKGTVAMETDDGQTNGVPAAEENADVNMHDDKSTAEPPSTGTTGAENGAPETEDKVAAQMETDAKVKTVKKKKVKKTEIPFIETILGGLPKSDLQKAQEKEFEMALQDRIMEETKEKKNAVEAYVYDMRNKLYEKYDKYVIEQEREDLTTRLQIVEDWLYDEGEDETKGVYIAKLEELKKFGDPIEERYKEDMERGPLITSLEYCINSYRDAALSKDPKFDHIDVGDKQKVLNECNDAEHWLREKRQQQDLLPKYVNPVLLANDVKRKAETLDRFCRPIMTKPRPAPAKPQQSPPPPPPPEAQATENAGNNAPPPEGHAAPTEAMDTDNTQMPESE